MILGNIGVYGAGVNPLRGQQNVQGACDVGALSNVFSGYQQVVDPAARAKMAKAWTSNPCIRVRVAYLAVGWVMCAPGLYERGV
jgi:predicted molibdopterin-dependent oxidoreductase YjgC